MMIRLKYWALTFVFLMNYSQLSVALMRPSIALYVQNTFYAYLDHPGEVQSCWFQIQYTKKQQVYLNSTTPITLENGFTILPFSTTTCGVVGNVSASYNGVQLTLEANYVDGQRDAGQATIHRQTTPQALVTKETIDIGETTITCSMFQSYQRRCKIVDETGESWDKCQLRVTIRKNRIFDCYVNKVGDPVVGHEQIQFTVNKPSQAVTNSSIEETDRSIILRCQFLTGAITSCQAQPPNDNKEFYIKDGQNNGRFSAYDTKISQSKCALEIVKPLADSQIGLWRIVSYESASPSGCLFYVGDDKKDIIEEELQLIENKVVNVTTNAVQLPEIDFMLPFVLEYCYLLTSYGQVVFSDSQEFKNQRSYGKCSFSNLTPNNGTWKFGAFGKDYDAEVMRNVDVIMKSSNGELITPNVKVKKGHDADLMCRSTFDEPISDCLFIDPENNVHIMGTGNRQLSAGHVEYNGRGLEYGDCGIHIHNVQDKDYGNWQCQYTPVSKGNSYMQSMEITKI